MAFRLRSLARRPLQSLVAPIFSHNVRASQNVLLLSSRSSAAVALSVPPYLGDNNPPRNPDYPRPPQEIHQPEPLVPQTWTPEDTRCGAIGTKLGMIHIWNAIGVLEICTVVQMDACQVIRVQNHISTKGRPFVMVQLGAVDRKPKGTKKPILVHCRKAGANPKRVFKDFTVSENGVLPVGHIMSARHFVPGQYVDVQGTSKGHGFQGAMKRWGFKGQPASHGVSKTHRSLGSTGSSQDPGRVWKGKKMAGHMGNKRSTHRNLQIFKIDVKRNLIFIKGAIPGPKGSFCRLRDSTFKEWDPLQPPPFPTYVPKAGEEDVDEVVMDISHHDDPFEIGLL